MVNLNGKDYKLYYLDTCALSNMVKDRPGFGSKLLNLVLADGIMAISSYSLWELKSHSIYDEVISVITVLPCVLLKSEQLMFESEFEHFNNDQIIISPILASMLKTKNNIDIISLIEEHITNIKNIKFKNSRSQTFQFISQEASNIYSREDLKVLSKLQFSVSMAAYMLASEYIPNVLRKYVDAEEEFPIDKFPSLLSISYMKHYKYLQSKRKGEESDIPDILMSALYPYVDVIITEGNQCELIKQIKRNHNFWSNATPISIKEFNKKSQET
ncbi:hypothetical protein ACFGVR_23480 [Mucilaginibacter sp. AW1-3]